MTHSKSAKPSPPSELDALAAPWMKFALDELDRKVGEHDAAGAFQRNLYGALAANHPRGPSLLDWNKLNLQTARDATKQLGPLLMVAENPDVKKYLDTVVTDPIYDGKHHRTFKLDPVCHTDKGWRMTAWCAAFVNWCLMQAKVPNLGYATAASWVKFGMPIKHPQYGCVMVINPSSDTGSTTGHVAFYGGSVGEEVWLLGGNQNRAVSWTQKNNKVVRAFRWPATVGDFQRRSNNTAIA